jgi:hypothetical protein
VKLYIQTHKRFEELDRQPDGLLYRPVYGMVNKAMEELIVSGYGAGKWQAVKEKAGVHDVVFLSSESYPDKLTYDLVSAASDVLELPAREILVAFGEHWVLKTARLGYGSMLEANGRTLSEFLINLPSLHTRVAMIFPDLQPPRFHCSDITEDSLHLHYHSHRLGLTDFVVGLLQGLAVMFETPAEIQITERKSEGADHDVFLVRWQNPAST